MSQRSSSRAVWWLVLWAVICLRQVLMAAPQIAPGRALGWMASDLDLAPAGWLTSPLPALLGVLLRESLGVNAPWLLNCLHGAAVAGAVTLIGLLATLLGAHPLASAGAVFLLSMTRSFWDEGLLAEPGGLFALGCFTLACLAARQRHGAAAPAWLWGLLAGALVCVRREGLPLAVVLLVLAVPKVKQRVKWELPIGGYLAGLFAGLVPLVVALGISGQPVLALRSWLTLPDFPGSLRGAGQSLPEVLLSLANGIATQLGEWWAILPFLLLAARGLYLVIRRDAPSVGLLAVLPLGASGATLLLGLLSRGDAAAAIGQNAPLFLLLLGVTLAFAIEEIGDQLLVGLGPRHQIVALFVAVSALVIAILRGGTVSSLHDDLLWRHSGNLLANVPAGSLLAVKQQVEYEALSFRLKVGQAPEVILIRLEDVTDPLWYVAYLQHYPQLVPILDLAQAGELRKLLTSQALTDFRTEFLLAQVGGQRIFVTATLLEEFQQSLPAYLELFPSGLSFLLQPLALTPADSRCAAIIAANWDKVESLPQVSGKAGTALWRLEISQINAAARLFTGIYLRQRGLVEDSLVYLRQVADNHKGVPVHWHQLGLSYEAKRDFENAKRAYFLAVTLDMENMLFREAYYRVAVLSKDEETTRQAETWYIAKKLPLPKVASKDPLDEGGAAMERRLYLDAERAFEQYTHEQPDDAKGWFYLGQSRRGMGNFLGARNALLRAIERDTEADQIRAYLAEMLVQSGMVEQAQEHYKLLLRRNPESASVAGLVLDVARELPDLNVGLAAANQFERLSPDDPTASLELGRILLALGRLDSAREALLRAVGKTPPLVEARVLLAGLEHEAGNAAAARVWLEKAAALDPEHPFVKGFRQVLDAPSPPPAGTRDGSE